MFALDPQCLEHLSVLLLNLWIIGRAIVNIAEDLKCFLVSTMRIEISWRFRKTKNKDDDDNGKNDLTCNG